MVSDAVQLRNEACRRQTPHSITDFFEPFDEVLYQLNPEGQFGTRLAAYIRAHADAFGDALNTFPKAPRWPNRRAAMS